MYGLKGDINLFIKIYLENRNIITRIDNTNLERLLDMEFHKDLF